MFVLAISAWYMLKGRDLAFARRSFAIAAAFGLAASCSVIVLGDESGYELGDVQKVKLAAVEAEWETHPAPASFTIIGIPNSETQHTDYAVKVPYALGLIATRSLDKQVLGLKDLKEIHRTRIVNGMEAYRLLKLLRAGDTSADTKTAFEAVKKDLGYGLLLTAYAKDPSTATPEQIQQAVDNSIPAIAPMFWAFRIMVAAGFIMLFVFAMAFWFSAKRLEQKPTWFLKLAVVSLPLPWIACEAGWFVAEYGRQPWAVGEVLPTHLAASALTAGQIWTSLGLITALYTVFLVIEIWLMQHFARKGPSALHTGKYDLETGKVQGV
ncbi:MAG: cytochrome ubiquinol oxidase subunit I, partial [Gammaproteobacteria bacterium]|nr:cytochrome ubiquinol oxidase subunit I [Gammaproteobacteria bacterium]